MLMLYPDIPRWVEARAAQLTGHALPIGDAISASEDDAVWIIGEPDDAHIREAVATSGGDVIAGMEHAERLAALLPGWTRERIVVHSLIDRGRLPDPGQDVHFLDPGTITSLDIDDELRDELTEGATDSQIAAMFVNDAPVAFSYAGAETETLWDISVDTVPDHRRRGYAGRCVARMIEHMAPLEPVWQAVESNPASWRLAAKLGFEPVDELVLFVAPSD